MLGNFALPADVASPTVPRALDVKLPIDRWGIFRDFLGSHEGWIVCPGGDAGRPMRTIIDNNCGSRESRNLLAATRLFVHTLIGPDLSRHQSLN